MIDEAMAQAARKSSDFSAAAIMAAAIVAGVPASAFSNTKVAAAFAADVIGGE